MDCAAAGGAFYLQLSAYAFVAALRTGSTMTRAARESAENAESPESGIRLESNTASGLLSNRSAPTLGAAPWYRRCHRVSFIAP